MKIGQHCLSIIHQEQWFLVGSGTSSQILEWCGLFIPNKSKRPDARFAFIRYDCPVAADVAVSKPNGIWFFDRKLWVMIAYTMNQ